ncbi:MAG TPA: prefoldin subunit beta [Candidatus Thermoplasmatota archaeon]|nr:prefoldin subunit beta [Candidatus Thermoplasmatota archaeon]
MPEHALPAKLQGEIANLQAMNAQLQQAAAQRAQFEMLKAETAEALDALAKLPDGAAVYRNVGSLLLQEKGKAAAEARLKEDLETLEVRLTRLAKQEQAIRESAQALQKKIQAALPKA